MKFTCILITVVLIFETAAAQSTLSLDDILARSAFSGKSVAGFASMQDGEHYCATGADASGNNILLLYSFKTGQVTDTLVNASELQVPGTAIMIDPGNFIFSADEQKILFESDEESIYRHSKRAEWLVFDRSTQQLKPLSPSGKQQVPQFSPDNGKVAFVRSNNLFYTDLTTGLEVQVSKDGQINSIINGITDWVYEEEFAFVQAYAWSPDGRYLACYRFDESEVAEFTLQYYKGLYPENYTYRYPKAGEKNSVVSLFIYELATGKSVPVDLGPETNQYIPRIKWTQDANTLCVMRMNRLQNQLDLLLADAATGKTRLMFREENKRYIEIHDHLTFFNSNRNFLWMSEMNGYNHLYIGNVSDGKLMQVTSGNWDVTDYYGMNEKNKTLLFQSAEASPMERHVYEISTNGKKKRLLTPESGWNEASFSKTYSYMMVTHSDANTPWTFRLYNAAGKLIRTLETNAKLLEKLKQYSLSRKTFFSFRTSEGTELNGWLLKPFNFDSTKKYPVFMTAYGGPGSQKALDQWGGSEFMFHQYLAQEGYVVACIDNRGTGARGEEFRKMTYLQLGKYEPLDQIEGARYLSTWPFIDAGRISIFGWSYGGYLSALCMELGASVFKAGISVAPVTDWRFYDSVYTERYMRDPQQNEAGYVNGSPLTHAAMIKGNFLLIAGTADDNVHFQNTAAFMKKLYENNVRFDQLTFPDKNHSISGGNTRYYLYSSITEWLRENL